MNFATPITDADFQAYVDGQLSKARYKQVDLWLDENPAAIHELYDYQAINLGLHTLYDDILAEPIPERMQLRSVSRWHRRAAAVVAWVCLCALLYWGYTPSSLTGPQQRLQEQLVKPASFAHYIYSSDLQRPVEISATEERNLTNYLSDRLHTEVAAPNLSSEGYELIGGRLLPSTNRMAAQFMYSNQKGERITLYLRRITTISLEPEFRFIKQNNINTLYWLEKEFGYAISGQLEKQELIKIAEITTQLYSIDK